MGIIQTKSILEVKEFLQNNLPFPSPVKSENIFLKYIHFQGEYSKFLEKIGNNLFFGDLIVQSNTDPTPEFITFGYKREFINSSLLTENIFIRKHIDDTYTPDLVTVAIGFILFN